MDKISMSRVETVAHRESEIQYLLNLKFCPWGKQRQKSRMFTLRAICVLHRIILDDTAN